MSDSKPRDYKAPPPEDRLWDLTPGTVAKLLAGLGVTISPCRECGHEGPPYLESPDKLAGLIPRFPALGLDDSGKVLFSPSAYQPVVHLSCSRCGYTRSFGAYTLAARLIEEDESDG